MRSPTACRVACIAACLGTLAAGCWAAPARADAEADLAAQRLQFTSAYAAARAGEPPPEAGDSELLQAYALYPYVQAERLRAEIGRADPRAAMLPVDDAAATFLAGYGEDPAGRIVRRAWLASLFARGQWRSFLDVYGQARAPDQALRCQAIRARLALGQVDGLAEPATAEWLTGTSADDACDPVFEWLRVQGTLGATLVEQRARLALEAGQTGLARRLAKSLPEETARPLREWALLLENPQQAIDALIAAPGTPVDDAALVEGWSRLARRNPDSALDRFDALLASRKADASLASRLARGLALGLAWSRRGNALDYFERIAAADCDDLTWEWHARAALWAGDWARAGSVIAAMPQPLQEDPRWRYWAARVAGHTGNVERSRELYAAALPAENWYAVLAAARLGRPFAPAQRELVFDAARLWALERVPAFTRARELFVLSHLSLAQAEWNAGYPLLDAASQYDAIGLASRWGWHFQAIATAAQQRLFDDYRLLYPMPFDEQVAEAARHTGLPSTLIYAVIRQESLYQPWAVSGAGAVGLMQILPETARRTAARMQRRTPTRASLVLPEVNVPLGAGTLADFIRRMDGQVLVAIAGYNAGPSAARRWLPDEPMDADIWVENIPFNETRTYVQKVMWHSVVFEWLADGEPEDASSWITRVRPVE
jgi:soluble lytic murein transglycosylase